MIDPQPESTAPIYQNTNGMPLHNGKNVHMEVGFGDIANRVITVGAFSRAEKVATYLDATPPHSVIHSSRGFSTITGFFNGVQVSIVSIGMGPAMMDFFVRETRAVVHGPMAMIRFGTCGGLTPDATEGTIVVAAGGSGYICRNPDAFAHRYEQQSVDSTGTVVDDENAKKHHSVRTGGGDDAYLLRSIAPANAELSALLQANLSLEIDAAKHLRSGTNITADSFYSSQGRIDPNFDDDNTDIIELLHGKYPGAMSLEMESFFLLHLARCSKVPIKATAAAIVVANRGTGNVIDGDVLDVLERKGAKAMLQAITQIPL